MQKTSIVFSVLFYLAANIATAQDGFAPFPENRVRDFYFRQAEQHLSSSQPIPDLLRQFPGLDGGAFGHWGQNPAEQSIDNSLNEVDSGNVICSRVIHFGTNTQKGVAVRLSDGDAAVSVVFDPLSLSFVDSWQGGFVSRGSSRYGVHDGARAVGQQLFDFSGSRWHVPKNAKTRYLGFYRNGANVVFSYAIGDATVYDQMWLLDDLLVRSLQFDGRLPTDTRLSLFGISGPPQQARSGPYQDFVAAQKNKTTSVGFFDVSGAQLVADEGQNAAAVLSFEDATPSTTLHLQFRRQSSKGETTLRAVGGESPHAPSLLVAGGAGQWAKDVVTTTGELGDESAAYAIDTLTIPYATANPFRTPMRLAGAAAMDGGRMAVSTLLGDVWVVSGVNDNLQELKWQRVAAGLYQPLGLTIKDGRIILGGNDQITRLHDLNGDGEADFYECVTNEYPTTGGHDFATSLQQDNEGRLYWATASGDFGLTRLTEGQKPESLGSGLRNSNGIGVSADGSIVLATVQEGTWAPGTAIFNISDGSFHGHRGPREGIGEFGYDLPQCFVPRGIDNSAGEIRFLPDDKRLGPLAGKVLGSSYGYCNVYMILREEVDGHVQGGLVPLPGEFQSGSCRLTFNEHDGHIYVAGTEGWQSYAAENGCLQRLRFTGRPLHLPTQIETRQNGLIVHCNTEISPDSVRKENVFCQQWNYLYSGAYGSPEYSVKDEGRQGHDHVPVRSVHLLKDKRSVFIEIPQLHPVMQFHLHMKLTAADGAAFTPDAYSSIYAMGESFTDFPGYQLIAKRRWPGFPHAEKYEQDPRLIEQDAFGTNFGWVSSAKKLTLNAVTGLQYEPKRLKVAPGTRVALTFHNTDPSMPHNVVVIKADAMEEFGGQSMVLASNPRAIATHYVPDDPAEICFSPILNPGDQYTVYFEAPKETGRYRFLCTYPGHWKVMRGSLYILPDDQPLPPPAADEITRRFVKRWTMPDFQIRAEQLDGRSAANGETVFNQAGCVKCHRIKDKGAKLGPELSDVNKRYKGEKLLQQILAPSSDINKQYQTWIAVRDDGTVLSGLMTEQNDTSITLLPNPLKPDQVITINRKQIDELIPSKQSTMPDGLLMTFSRDEILDLLAFIQQNGSGADQ
ncbi:MAG: c-type cytochrome [Fuerstiella sp.]|nr:c-type cytochrome [Fuerstiella sp.]